MVYESESGNIQIMLTGDAVVSRPLSIFREPDYLSLVELVRAADVSVANAETLFHNYEDAPTSVPGGTYMRAHPSIVGDLSWFGVDMLATANNHAYDYGENGLTTNLRHLAEAGIVHAGIGRHLGEARQPAYLDTRAGRVALISATLSGPQGMYAQHQWRDGRGRPGANMLRYTMRYTVDRPTFDALKRLRSEFELFPRVGFMDHSYGASRTPETDEEFFMADLHDVMQYPTPNGYRIALGDRFDRTLVPEPRDWEENLQRIRDARRMADWVVVSLHNHERGATMDLPSNLAVEFAHAAIDAGADVFHGHGPHRDRGIEIYQGKPIFYSIGHFIFQNDTVDHVPLDNMLRQGLEGWENTPADFFDRRTGRESHGQWNDNQEASGRVTAAFGAQPAAWRDIVAVVEFSDRELHSIRLQPIDLGFQRSRSQRGRPVIARGATAREVLELFQELSAPFGTQVEIDGEVGFVRL